MHGFGVRPCGVALDERPHDGGAELLAEVERDVREPEPMARLARRDHGGGRAARALGARAGGIEPEPQGDADRVRSGAQERHRTVDAAAHRDGDPSRGGRGGERRRDRIRKRIRSERLAGHRCRLEQREADERPLEARRIRLDDDARPRRPAARRRSPRRARSRRSVRAEACSEASGQARSPAGAGFASHTESTGICVTLIARGPSRPHQVHVQPTDTMPHLRQSGVRQ